MRRFVFASLISAALLLPVYAQDTSEVQQRKEKQQQRIANGVKSGKMTAGETARAETNEAKINKETAKDRAANGGKLTPGEKAKVNHQQNKESKQIYKEKHNDKTQ